MKVKSTFRRSSVTMSDIDSMSGLEFEAFVGELLKSLGYSGVQVTKSSGDQGVDVVATKGGTKYAIQCKNYSTPLNNKPIQEVTTGKAVYGCDVGVVLTNSTFNHSAIEAATATGTLLWDRSTLQRMLQESQYGKNTLHEDKFLHQLPEKHRAEPAIYDEKTVSPLQSVPAPSTNKKRHPLLYVIGIILLVFSGLGLFAGVVTFLQSGFGSDDIALFLFLLVLFLVGLFLVRKNKREKSNTKGSNYSYEPHSGKTISWVAVGLCLYFFFPVGFYLLCKKMSQYSNSDELMRNSKTLKNWATVFICLAVFCVIVAIASESLALIAAFPLIAMGLILIKKSNTLTQIYEGLLPEHKAQQAVTPVANSNIRQGGNYAEFLYNAGTVETTYVVVHCKGCNAPNRIAKGSTTECEYCGAPIGDGQNDETVLDNEEAAISRAFAVIQRLLESMDEVSDDLSDSFDRLTHAMETFPNRSMPLDIELNRVSSCLSNFTTEAKKISAGIRAQVMIACDNLMTYDDESWEKVELEVEKVGEIKNTLSETLSGMRTFKHAIETLNVNAGFQTHKIKTAQLQLAQEIDKSLGILQSTMHDFSESIKIFRNAKFTSKTQRINMQKYKGGVQ